MKMYREEVEKLNVSAQNSLLSTITYLGVRKIVICFFFLLNVLNYEPET